MITKGVRVSGQKQKAQMEPARPCLRVQRLPEHIVPGSGNCEQLLKGFRFRVQGKAKAQIEPARGAIVGFRDSLNAVYRVQETVNDY